jgi:hypothetical protein
VRAPHCLLGALALAATGPALAQEAMYTQSATMPSPGVLILRPQVNYWKFGAGPLDGTKSTERIESLTTLQYGLARALSLTAELPIEFDRRELSGGGIDHDQGVKDIGLTFKYRVFKHDTGGVDTLRGAILAGVHTPSGDDHDYSDTSIDPHLGFVLTAVRGRHGFNQEVMYRFNGGGDNAHNLGGGEGSSDAFFHNTAYLYRFSPETYTPATPGSVYGTIELNGIYETNGDYELRWSPGFMYEAKSFALELMAQFPLYHRLSERAELDFSVGFGVRWTF